MDILCVQYFKDTRLIYCVWLAGITNSPKNSFCFSDHTTIDRFVKKHPSYGNSIVQALRDKPKTNQYVKVNFEGNADIY